MFFVINKDLIKEEKKIVKIIDKLFVFKEIKLNGINFWIVDKMKIFIHESDFDIEIYQWWKGNSPIFIIKDRLKIIEKIISQFVFILVRIINIKIIHDDEKDWIKKYKIIEFHLFFILRDII